MCAHVEGGVEKLSPSEIRNQASHEQNPRRELDDGVKTPTPNQTGNKAPHMKTPHRDLEGGVETKRFFLRMGEDPKQQAFAKSGQKCTRTFFRSRGRPPTVSVSALSLLTLKITHTNL